MYFSEVRLQKCHSNDVSVSDPILSQTFRGCIFHTKAEECLQQKGTICLLEQKSSAGHTILTRWDFPASACSALYNTVSPFLVRSECDGRGERDVRKGRARSSLTPCQLRNIHLVGVDGCVWWGAYEEVYTQFAIQRVSDLTKRRNECIRTLSENMTCRSA